MIVDGCEVIDQSPNPDWDNVIRYKWMMMRPGGKSVTVEKAHDDWYLTVEHRLGPFDMKQVNDRLRALGMPTTLAVRETILNATDKHQVW